MAPLEEGVGVQVRGVVRKWDVHIHCNQHFQSGMFEISIFFLIWYRVRCGGVGLASWMGMPMRAVEGHGTGERARGRKERDR